ncbi:terminase large subunit domain-containing protein [Sphingobium nicotianae]|uniref:Terminase family protein n=1 Tax=Sphingobium nicotianae TaxID=2782607 RepID=A0A9X1IQK2_9SPHN|nr:terminase family protein [Sphingobium nicotianae]MBT2186704.1 terminase family protein [Sphingobium nicotianae]
MNFIREIFAARLRTAEKRARVLGGLNDGERDVWQSAWREWAHAGQVPPPGDWRTWVLMAGRGFGKTRAGAQWVAAMVRAAAAAGDGAAGAGEPLRIALVAATADEARRIMVEGRSGILAIAAEAGAGAGRDVQARPRFEPSRQRVIWPCGAEAALFSGANPEALRGPEHHYAWCDELAKWRHPEETWDMLQLGLRAGERPRALVTTTPREGSAVLTRILAMADTVKTGGASGVNPHLPDAWLAAVTAEYGDTRLGRQELGGELIADLRGTLWPAALIEASRGAAVEPAALVRVVIGVDPPASAAGVCGIVACGLDGRGIGHVLADETVEGRSPDGWARAVAAAAERHGADRVIAEGNQGGDMVRSVLASAGLRMAVTLVSATRSKAARAEPAAGLFEAGRARFAGRFPVLEAQLAGLIAGGGYEGPGRSPDRADAMVWALHALMLAPGGAPSVRVP